MTPENPLVNQVPAAPEQAQQPAPVDATNLPRELWYPIWQLLVDMETQDEIPRRYEVREILKRRLFFRGEQYWWWNGDTNTWCPPNQVPLGVTEDDFQQPSFQHVTNILQAYSLSLCSVLSQNNTAARFWPEKPSNFQDIQTAKNASKVADLIHRQNDWQNLIDQQTYYMCTDGFLGSFTRYVSDGEKFGHDERDIYSPTEVAVGPATVSCPSCGYSAEGTTETQPICPDCGQPVQDVAAPTATVPTYAGTVKIPRGQEVVSFVPALQLRRTMWADDQSEFLYLDWITDAHKSVVMATYPDKAKAINSSDGGEPGGVANSYERIARRILYLGTGRHTGMVLRDLGTFQRAWIRPKAFWAIDGHADGETTPCTRCQLLNLFPDGCKIVFFNGVYCESANESMDEKWETMHTMPGEGQLRETLTSAMIPIQEQLNDAINLLFEIMMYGVPEGFAADKLLDFEARSRQTANAGNLTPVNLDGTAGIGDKLMFTPAVEPSQAMMAYINLLLNQIPQLISGAFPALFGGDTGSNDTAAGISIQRNQALGRIGRAWRRMQTFLANTDAKAVRCFAKNRTEDVEIPKETNSGEYESDFIRLEDLQGNVIAYPEVDAQYPTLQADIRNLIMNLYNGAPANPLTLSMLQIPENLEYVMRMLGATDLEVPGEQQRIKTNKDIERLVQEQPVMTPPQPGQPPNEQNPQGVPPQPPQAIPSIQPDADVDDLKVAADTCKAWLISDAGLEAKETNPMGYQNVLAYLKACTQMGKAQQLQQAVAAQALSGTGPLSDLGGAEHISATKRAMPPPPEAGPSGPQPSTA